MRTTNNKTPLLALSLALLTAGCLGGLLPPAPHPTPIAPAAGTPIIHIDNKNDITNQSSANSSGSTTPPPPVSTTPVTPTPVSTVAPTPVPTLAPTPVPPVVDTFSIDTVAANPDRNWAIGYSGRTPADFKLMGYKHSFKTTAGDTYVAWFPSGVGQQPSCTLNPLPQSMTPASWNVVIPAKATILHPSDDGQYCVVRWTAPRSGTFNVTATFTGLNAAGECPATTDVSVQDRARLLWSANVNETSTNVTYTGLIALQKDESIFFMVGKGSNDYSCDSTLFSAQING